MERTMKESGIEWVGIIPENWNVLRNKNCFILEKNIVGDEFEQYDLLSLTKKGIVKKSKDNAFGKTPESYSTYQSVKKGQIVMCLFDLDMSAVFSGLSDYDGMISPAYKTYNCNSNILNSFAKYWFEYCFDGRKYKIYSKSLRYVVNADDFGSIKIVVPPMDEQEKIVAFLDDRIKEIDAVILQTKESIDEYKKYKRTVITETVTKGLDEYAEMQESQYEHIGAVPKHWEIKKIKYVLFESGERTKTGKEEPLSMSQKWGLIPTREMDVIPNMASSFDNCKIVHVNDLVFNKLKAHLGVFAKSGYEGLVSPDYAVYQAKNNDNMLFLEYVFKTPQYISQFIKYSKGVAQGLTRLYTEELFSIYIAMPPKEEQDRITEVVKERCAEIDALIAKKEAFVEEMETYKKSLIYEYVTGKKEVV